MATICLQQFTVERLISTNMVPIKKRPFEESKKTKIHGPVPKQQKMSEEEIRLKQLELIFNTCYSMFFVDRLENSLLIPHIIVNSCDLLERVRLKISIRKTYRHIAAACLLLTCQIDSDMIGAFSRKEFIKRFHDTDPTITTKALSKAQKQVLEAINYELWYNNESRARIGRWPLLELDPDVDSRNLQELGFLAEQCIFQPSLRENKFFNISVVQSFINSNPGYLRLQQRFRKFCRDPSKFFDEHYVTKKKVL